MNSSMFLPQVAEQDIYNSSHQQEDDINTVIEYIDQVILGHHDPTPEDEDDDSGQNFHLANACNYYYEPFLIQINTTAFSSDKQQHFGDLQVKAIPSVYFDILSPPPELS